MAEEKVVSEAEELPKAIVRRVVKDKLSELSGNSDDISVFKESLQALSESARIFIHYLSATANDICKESKRQTINADDVFKALEEIEFSEFIGPLKASLEEFKKKKPGKKTTSATKDSNKKQKTETPLENGGEEVEVEVADDAINEDGDDDNMNENGDGDGDANDDDMDGGDGNNMNGDDDDAPDED